jgi:uncharacterized membrane protein YpjA
MDLPATYHAWILWTAKTTGLTDPLLHLHAGMAVLLVAWIVSRRALASFVPFGAVAAAEGINELMDYLQQGWRAADTFSDVVNTLFWPLALSACARALASRSSR